MDRRILETLCLHFTGRPVGLSTLAVSVGEEPETVEDVYEPFLLQAGLIMRTPRGRVAASAAYAHLGLEVPVQLSNLLLGGDHEGSDHRPLAAGPRGAQLQDSLFSAQRGEDGCKKDPALGD